MAHLMGPQELAATSRGRLIKKNLPFTPTKPKVDAKKTVVYLDSPDPPRNTKSVSLDEVLQKGKEPVKQPSAVASSTAGKRKKRK